MAKPIIALNSINNKLEVFNTPQDFQDFSSQAEEGTLRLLDNKDIKYNVKNIEDGTTKLVSGGEAEDLIGAGWQVESSDYKEEGALKTFGKSFIREATFGLAKKRHKEGSPFAAREDFETYQKSLRSSKLASFGGGAAGFLLGGPFGAGAKVGAKITAKVAPKAGKALKALDVNRLTAEIGRGVQKSVAVSKFLTKIKADKIAGRSAEWAAMATPYAIAHGLDNRNTESVAEGIKSGATWGAGFQIAKGTLGTAGKALGIAGKLAKTGVQKGAKELSTSFAERFFNVQQSPEKLKEFVTPIIKQHGDDIITNLGEKGKQLWAKNIGKPLTKEGLNKLTDEQKIRVVGDFIKNKFPQAARDKYNLSTKLKEQVKSLGEALETQKKTLGERFKGGVFSPNLSKDMDVLKTYGQNFTKNVNAFLQSKILPKFKNLENLTPEGKDLIKKVQTIQKGISIKEGQKLGANKAYQKFLKDFEMQKEKLGTLEKNVMNKLKDMGFFKEGVAKPEKIQQLNKFMEQFNKRKEETIQAFEKAKGEFSAHLGFKDMDDLVNVFTKISKDSQFKGSPELNKILNSLKQMRAKTILDPKKAKAYEKINQLYSTTKTIEGQISGRGITGSALQGAGVAGIGKDVLFGLGGLALTGGSFLAGGPIGGITTAAILFGGYNLFPIATKKGWGNLATANMLTRIETGLKNSRSFNQVINNPEGLIGYMKRGFEGVLGKSPSELGKPLAVKSILDMLDLPENKEDEKKPDDLASLVDLNDRIVRGGFDNTFGTIDSAFQFVQDINQEPNPELDVERIITKQKIQQIADHFMPEEIKRAAVTRKPPVISQYKIDEFKDNFQTVMNPRKVYEKVKYGNLTSRQAMAFKQFNPKEYRKTIMNLLQVKNSLNYNQSKMLEKLLGNNEGFYLYENRQDHQAGQRQAQANPIPVKRKTDIRESELLPQQRGFA